MSGGLSAHIAAFARTDPGPFERDRARLRLLDAFGLAVAASSTPQVRSIAAMAAATCGAGAARTMDGRMFLAPAGAAAVNATLIHALDFDDTYLPGSMHTHPVVIPAVLAAASATDVSVSRVLSAIAIGSELACWLSELAGKPLHANGFHTTGVLGTIVASVAASVVLGLDQEGIINAIGSAGSTAGGTWQFEESWVKNWNVGMASVQGLAASFAALHGFVGPRQPLEGEYGIFRTHLGHEIDWPARTLGDPWLSPKIALKRFPCCQFLQSVSACGVSAASSVDLNALSAILVTLPEELAIRCVALPEDVRRRPENSYRARFAGHWLLARALTDRQVSLSTFDTALPIASEVAAIAELTSFEIGHFDAYPEFWPCRIRVTNNDGTTQEFFDDGKPLTVSEDNEAFIFTKLSDNLGYGGFDPEAGRVLENHLRSPDAPFSDLWKILDDARTEST